MEDTLLKTSELCVLSVNDAWLHLQFCADGVVHRNSLMFRPCLAENRSLFIDLCIHGQFCAVRNELQQLCTVAR